MSDLDKAYAKKKLELLLRDLSNYNAGEFWREMSRIASGATGTDHAEQLQQRNAELVERHPEWVCYTCNTVYPVDTVKRISNCICPSGCGGLLKPRSQTERLLEQRIEELEQSMEVIMQQRDNYRHERTALAIENEQLSATVDRLRGILDDINYELSNYTEHADCIIDIRETIEDFNAMKDLPPTTNLNHVKREVARQAYTKAVIDWCMDDEADVMEMRGAGLLDNIDINAEQYANTKYPSGKDGEVD